MPAESLEEALTRVRTLLIDLERHIDKAAADGDVAQVARAWVRAAQVERALRSVLPPDATTEIPDV